MAWFDKRITQEKLDKMDTKFTKRYGKQVKTVREKDLPIEDEVDPVVDEESQILEDARREAIDRDEKSEYESIEPEKEGY